MSTVLIIHLLFSTIYCGLSSDQQELTWIETTLQNWTLSNTQFYLPARYSIVGYDAENDKVIIFGGRSYYDNDLYLGFEQVDYYVLYVYDLSSDTLTPVSITWSNLKPVGYTVHNEATPNSVVIDKIMYFSFDSGTYGTEASLASLDLEPIYSYIDNIDGQSQGFSDIQPEILLTFNVDYGYTGGGCVTTDSTKEYLIISAMLPRPDYNDQSWFFNYAVIVYDIKSNQYFIGGRSSYNHYLGICGVIDDIFYVMDGVTPGVIEYIEIESLLSPGYATLKIFSAEIPHNSDATVEGRSIFSYDNLFYVLGGKGSKETVNCSYRHDLYRVNTSDQTVEPIDISWPGICEVSTILHEDTGRIYAFRGTEAFDDRIEYTTNIRDLFSIISNRNNINNNRNTPSPVVNSGVSSNVINDSNLSTTMELIIAIIIIGVLFICCTICIGVCVMNKIKAKYPMKASPNKSNKQSLIKIRSQSEQTDKSDQDNVEMVDQQQQNNNKNQGSDGAIEGKADHRYQEMKEDEDETYDDGTTLEDAFPTSMDLLSDGKVDELYQVYIKSKLDCFAKCDEFGMTDVFMEKLFETFEKYKELELDD